MPLFDPKYEVENLMRDRAAKCRRAGFRAMLQGDSEWADARARQALCLNLGAALAGYGDLAGAMEFISASEQFTRGDGEGGWVNGLAGFDGVDSRDAMDGLEGLDGFFSKVKKAVSKATKAVTKVADKVGSTTVGKVAASVVRVAAAPATAVVRIAQDVKNKGIVGAIKAVPSTVLYQPLKDVAKVATATVGTVAGKNTIVGKVVAKTDKAMDKATTWTESHPLQTIGAAAAVVGAVVAAPVIAAGAGAALTAAGGAVASGAGLVAANAGTIGTVISTVAPMLGAGSKPPTGPQPPNMGTTVEQAMGVPGATGGEVTNYTTVMDPQGNAYAVINGQYHAIDPKTGQFLTAPGVQQAGMFGNFTPGVILIGASAIGLIALLAFGGRRSA